ncbi:MarR family winged helix-turn-helix transcriptional regulator [Microbacterium sp. 18062]|uniref:MarR family winged helix-turn-helix transcriptional regulator n=1 Tax=Microbacterium sp. 18062 TaxID=2681410 RepID=UPI001356896E|nr:MarR family transcriptional regulator [Microbacterium sp. 18062]
MERRIADIEYEQMLQSRYSIARHHHEGGIERSVYTLLSRLSVQGPMTIAELSEALRLDASTLQRQTGAALRAGLLERIPDPSGGIARRFAVTNEGTARMRASRDRSIRALDLILENWSDDDVNRFADYLHRFNIDIENYTAKGPPRSRATEEVSD